MKTSWFRTLKNVTLCIVKNEEDKTFTFKDVCYESSKEEAMLAVYNDNKLTSDSHVKKNVKNLVKSYTHSQEYQQF